MAASSRPGTARGKVVPTPPALSAVVAAAAELRKLRRRTDLQQQDWTYWEIRTLNLHRVVGLFQPRRAFSSASDLESTLRDALGRSFKRGWWRGIAYGVVVDVSSVTLTEDDLKTLVDVRENSKGDLQWVILVARDAGLALGVHTWIEGYLSPVYRAIVEILMQTGCRVTSVRREKDGLMKFLTGVADARVAMNTLGTSRVAFPEFRNPDTAPEP